MHHRALRRLPIPPVTTISQPTFTGTPSFTQALQAAASRAWVRRVSSPPTASTSAKNTQTVSSPHSTRSYNRPGSSCKFTPEKFVKRGVATRVEVTKLRVGTEVEKERIANGILATTNVCSTNIPLDAPSAASCSTSAQETPDKVFLFHPDVGRTEVQPGILFGGDQLDLATDKPHNAEPRHDNTPRAFIEAAPTPPPPLKPALIPQAPIPSFLPTPTSQEMLYENLRFSLTLKPLPQFPALVDYHDSYPKFRSTKSYNFLIELSIRHAQFGVTSWLFDAMVQDKIPRDSITRRLSTRWLVRTGRWDQAWMQATGLTTDEVLYKPLRNGLPPTVTQIPWYMWVELLFANKRGALRRTRNFRWSIDEEGNAVRLPTLETISDPTPGTKAYMRRQRLLACVHPVLDSGAKEHELRPSLIKGAVYAILRDERASVAAELVKAYFSMLPAKISDETAAQCMGIIHLLLSVDTGHGLASVYAKRRLLVSLLKMHPSFKPSSTSLFLILAPLKEAKKSGTAAFNLMKTFRKSWGAEVVDTRVRRRVGLLAQKEGRMDIIQAIQDEEALAQRTTTSPSSVAVVSPTTQVSSDSRGLRRPPDRELFPHKGPQKVLWTKFRLRIRWKQRADNCNDLDGIKTGY